MKGTLNLAPYSSAGGGIIDTALIGGANVGAMLKQFCCTSEGGGGNSEGIPGTGSVFG